MRGEDVVWGAVILVALYVVVANAALILIAVLRVHGDYSVLFEIGRGAGLSAFGLILLQPVLAARLNMIERPFGLDVVSRFHKFMGIFAAALLLFHPTFMARWGMGWSLLFKLDIEWYYWVGRVTIVLVCGQVLLSVFRRRLGMGFEVWRRTHYTLAAIIVAAVFVHSWWGGYDVGPLSIEILWVVMVTVAFAAYMYHKILVPVMVRQHPYTVSEVRKLTPNVWDIKLVPPSGAKIYDYIPGQFHFVTFLREESLPVEEHHWTITSSPTQQGFVSSTIKESGDFTKTIGLTKPGDRALVQGPFGRFSYVLHPGYRDFVFIAGGIGITPLMAMLRHMRDTRADVHVTLLYVNRTEKDIVFREELDAMQAGDRPQLNVVHVLTRPTSEWQGETGRLDAEKMRRFAGDSLSRSAFFICSPPAMTAEVTKILRAERVSYCRIHTEEFSL